MDALLKRYAEQMGLPPEKHDDFVADYNVALAKQQDAEAAFKVFIEKYEVNPVTFGNFLIVNLANCKSESG